MKHLKTIVLASFVAASSVAYAQHGAHQVEANKKLIYEFYRQVWEPRDDTALPKFIPESYVEHNPNYVAGRSALMNVLKERRKGAPPQVQNTLHDPPELIIAEGDIVTWIFKRMRKDKDGKEYESFWFDTFRIKDGKIVEHWDGALLR